MNDRILLVDDDVNLLNSIRRQLRGKYNLTCAESGKEALDIIVKEKEFSVIVSDFKMPLMDGAELLSRVRDISKNSIRMMLTGQADMEAVIKVINEGEIFRFLLKPTDPELFVKNINDAMNQYSLVQSEKELLSKTLSGSLQVMTDLLVLVKPDAFNKSIRIKNIVSKMLKISSIENAWQIEIAAMLSQIGCITIPENILQKVYKNQNLEVEDRIIYNLYPQTSSELIIKIPRMKPVAEILKYQEKYFDGSGFPNDKIKGKELPIGARIIKVVSDLDKLLMMENVQPKEAIEMIMANEGKYDPEIVKLLISSLKDSQKQKKYILKTVKVDELVENMYLEKAVMSASGVIVGNAKQKVTKALILTFQNYIKNKEIENSIDVFILEE